MLSRRSRRCRSPTHCWADRRRQWPKWTSRRHRPTPADRLCPRSQSDCRRVWSGLLCRRMLWGLLCRRPWSELQRRRQRRRRSRSRALRSHHPRRRSLPRRRSRQQERRREKGWQRVSRRKTERRSPRRQGCAPPSPLRRTGRRQSRSPPRPQPGAAESVQPAGAARAGAIALEPPPATLGRLLFGVSAPGSCDFQRLRRRSPARIRVAAGSFLWWRGPRGGGALRRPPRGGAPGRRGRPCRRRSSRTTPAIGRAGRSARRRGPTASGG